MGVPAIATLVSGQPANASAVHGNNQLIVDELEDGTLTTTSNIAQSRADWEISEKIPAVDGADPANLLDQLIAWWQFVTCRLEQVHIVADGAFGGGEQYSLVLEKAATRLGPWTALTTAIVL